MPWQLIYVEEFTAWLDAQEEALQDEALARLELLKERGPLLGRPYADTVKDSNLSNLKELRFESARAPIRILYAFDPKQQGIILLGGNKQGDKRWYKTNIPIAEQRFSEHLEKQRKEEEQRTRIKGNDYTR